MSIPKTPPTNGTPSTTPEYKSRKCTVVAAVAVALPIVAVLTGAPTAAATQASTIVHMQTVWDPPNLCDQQNLPSSCGHKIHLHPTREQCIDGSTSGSCAHDPDSAP